MSDNKNETVEKSRRDFLKKGAKIAVYAPPIMLGLSSPSFATGWKKSGGVTYPHKQLKKKIKLFHSYLRNRRNDD
jgi:hypothetical protein